MTDTAPCHDRRLLLATNEAAATYFRSALLSDPGAGPRGYLTDRGFAALLNDTPWTVGYAPAGWTRLRDHFRHLGFTDSALLDAGLVTTASTGNLIDRFRGRLTFGIRDHNGDLVGFTARAAPRAAPRVPKYLNTPRTSLYDKSHALLGVGEQAAHLRSGATPVLVEGALDAVAVGLTDRDGAPRLAPVSPCGTALTDHQAALLGAVTTGDRVIVAFDRDRPGAHAAARAYPLLRPKFATLRATRVPPDTDPADLLRLSGPTGLRHHLENTTSLATRIVDDYLATWPQRRSNAEARVACLRGVARLVCGMTPPDVTEQAGRLPYLLGFTQETVTRELIEAAAPTPPRQVAGVQRHRASPQAGAHRCL
jgi:DNA primase